MVTNGPHEAASAPERAGPGRWRRRAVWALVAAVTAAVGAALLWPRAPQAPVKAVASPDDEDFEQPLAAAPGYVGPEACAPCHARRVADFQQTSHFRACRLPQPGAMPLGFAPGTGKLATHEPALRFEMTQAGLDFLVTAIHRTPMGEQRTSSRIGLVYGAHAADEVFFSWRGDRLYELPAVWLHPLQQWAHTTINRYGAGDFSRAAATRCLECHNTWFEHVAGTPNQYKRDSFILGVTCERCHGPGRDHVAFHQAHPRADAGHAVVHPGRLTRDRQIEVCTQCHSNAIKRRGPVLSYQPGEPLDASFRTIVTKHAENDHVANQVQYLRQSKCFQKNDTLTCTTCHNPHRPAPSGPDQRSCLKCHRSADCAEQDRLPAAVRSNCVGCHMPPRVWMNVHFHTADDQYVPPIRRYQHRIAIYPTARQEVLLAWYRTQPDTASRKEAVRLTEALVGHWLAEAENCRRQYRFLAAIGALREALRLEAAPATRAKLQEVVAIQAKLDADLALALHQIDEHRHREAIETLTKILAVKPDWAPAHAKLGTLYLITGQSEQAAKHLQAVAQCDPDDAYGYMMLGWQAYLQDKAKEAVQACRRADQIEPYNAEINYHWGLALAKLGRLPEAIAAFRRVLTIDPRHAGGCQGLSHALRQQGQAAEAVRYGRRATRLTHSENADILLTLAEAYAGAGRFAEARDTAAEALDTAERRSPALVPQIRLRLQEWGARAIRAAP
jgi:tetratricopeptide (TPR) repeat protein